MYQGNWVRSLYRTFLPIFIISFAFLSSFTFAAVPNPIVTPIAYDAGSKQRPFVSSPLNLAEYGYIEEEFLMSGTTSTFSKDGRWRSDGKWGIKVYKENQPYATRLLVRRPADAADFNGIVIIEWFNNTAFMDVDVIWAQSHTELLREGYVWIGVSAQYLGVAMLKNWDNERYGGLRHNTDGLSYGIFSQAAQAVRTQSNIILGELTPQGIIGAGESQSAIRLTTYVNAFQQDAAEVYDGILLYSRFHLAAPLRNGLTSLTPSPAYIRDDNQVKVIQLETEQDVFMFLFRLARQEDTGLLRTWEIPGASHYDDYGVSNLLPQYQRDFTAFSSIELVCQNSPSKIPQHYVVNAALSHFSKWIINGATPPHSPAIEYKNFKVLRDEHGNALGGIRLPHMEAPIATNNYANSGSFRGGNWFVNAFACPFLGNTVPFTKSKLESLYPTHEEYVEQFTRAADAAMEDGFLLPDDYEEAVSEAQAMEIP